MLEDFSVETFLPLVGAAFRVDADGAPLELELAAADQLGEAPATPEGRTPFSLTFRGPGEPVLPQRIYRFEHGEIGAFEIFIVPIGRDADGVRYEAIFT